MASAESSEWFFWEASTVSNKVGTPRRAAALYNCSLSHKEADSLVSAQYYVKAVIFAL